MIKLPVFLLMLLLVSSVASARVYASNQSPTAQDPIANISEAGCPRVDQAQTAISDSKVFANYTNYRFYDYADQFSGGTCDRLLFYQSSSSQPRVEFIVGPSMTIIATYEFPANLYNLKYSNPAYGQNPIWAGYEANYCDASSGGTCTQTGPFIGSAMYYYLPTISTPNPEDTICCTLALWTGIGDDTGAQDGVLAQIGSTQNIAFQGTNVLTWWELLPSAPNYFTLSCVTPATGDEMFVESESKTSGNVQLYLEDYANTSCYFYKQTSYIRVISTLVSRQTATHTAKTGLIKDVKIMLALQA